jgi:hypothetical protein
MSLRSITLLIIFASFLSCNNSEKRKEKKLAPSSSEEVSIVIQKSKNDTLNDLIQITQPLPGQNIKSPLNIEGIAKGYWFFEASFRVELTDENYQLITESNATATKEWMTEDWVPFTGTLQFPKPKTKNGYLIFYKANPSGMLEKEMSDTLKIRFQ